MIDNFEEPCRSTSKQLFCHFAFPSCYLANGYQTGLPICQEDCIAVRNLFCVNEWLLVQQYKEENKLFKSHEHFKLPECEVLPKHGKGEKNVCSHIGLTDVKEDEVTHDCINDNGRWYFGKQNVTHDGIPCQRWDAQEPHSHTRPPNIFPEIQNGEDYCRNAGGEESKPWCYTMNEKVRWQHCEIPPCKEIHRRKSDGDGNLTLDPGMLLIACGAGLGSLLLLAFIALLIFKLINYIAGLGSLLFLAFIALFIFKVIKQRNGYTSAASMEPYIDLSKLPDNSSYHHTGTRLNPKLEKLQYDRNRIIFIRDLGQGAFGKVFHGKAPSLVPGEDLTLVAVKVLKEDASEDLLGDFEREASTLAEFDHPNIVRLLGVCAIGRPMCLIFEFMECGDLNEFLRSCSPTNYIVRSTKSDSFSDSKLSYEDMLQIGTQISAGMVYLSDRKFVHRDLATRNCLIGKDMKVKIADFGLSQKIYLLDYYQGDDSDAIPIRWMPLESILYNTYTIESDVWAFGVCLWEIFSFALQPYYGKSHMEVVTFLKDGGLLSCPEHCTQEVYGLMKWCWQSRIHDRPPFTVLNQLLSDLSLGRKIHVPNFTPSSSATTTPYPCSSLGRKIHVP
ncbi:unnamed protein product, partial [Meganyctiphanes norvegica]